MYALTNNVTYFESFRVKHVQKEIKNLIGNKSIQANNFRMQVYDSVMCVYSCIRFIDFILEDKSLTDFSNLFYLNIIDLTYIQI